ncbi:MAG: hypothetical protein C4304_09860 [candidate division GAL15 bacterium]
MQGLLYCRKTVGGPQARIHQDRSVARTRQVGVHRAQGEGDGHTDAEQIWLQTDDGQTLLRACPAVYRPLAWEASRRRNRTGVERHTAEGAEVRVTVDEPVAQRVCLGVVQAEGLVVCSAAPEVWEQLEALAGRLRELYGGRSPSEIEALQPARELYRSTGEDPTKTRPASEALLRRILRGQPLPRVNSLVDLCNLCSLEFLLPIGLYDLDRVRGTVQVRLGRPGEAYESLGKGILRAEGRLVVCDEEGPVGSPTHDSARTAIRLETRRALVLVFGPGSYAGARMAEHVEVLSGRLRSVACAASVRGQVLGGR